MQVDPTSVVIVRPGNVDIDARGKKIATTLAAAGYRVTMLGSSPDGLPHEERRGDVTVRLVPHAHEARDAQQARMKRRRSWRPRIGPHTAREYRLARNKASGRSRAGGRRARVTGVASLATLQVRFRFQRAVDGAFRAGWGAWGRAQSTSDLFRVLAHESSARPEIVDAAAAFGPVIRELSPDVVHAHHPEVLGAAFASARALAERGKDVRVVYDARENFAGIPKRQQGRARWHQALLNQEARHVKNCAEVFTVSDAVADALVQRLALERPPTVLLNVPPRPSAAPDATDGVREAAGVASDVPLLVYSGGVHYARGVGVLVEALPALPTVHLALVTVPFPHPLAPSMTSRAVELGVADRLHILAPVPQDELVDFLASATVGVHPLEGGSPNHDAALPNKLFEYLHAGLPMVVSDAREMAAFVRRHQLGEVFRSGDPEDFARAVRAVLDGTTPVVSGRERAELVARYSWEEQEAKLISAYRRIRPPGSPGSERTS